MGESSSTERNFFMVSFHDRVATSGQAVWEVVRGGAFNNHRDNARCAYRNRNQPDNRNNNLGFRVVLRSFPVISVLC